MLMMVSEWQKMIVGRWAYKRVLEKELCIILWNSQRMKTDCIRERRPHFQSSICSTEPKFRDSIIFEA